MGGTPARDAGLSAPPPKLWVGRAAGPSDRPELPDVARTCEPMVTPPVEPEAPEAARVENDGSYASGVSPLSTEKKCDPAEPPCSRSAYGGDAPVGHEGGPPTWSLHAVCSWT